MASTLTSMRVNVDNMDLAMVALNGLPPVYGILIVTLDAMGNDDDMFTFDRVKSRLFQGGQRAYERRSGNSKQLGSLALVGVGSQHSNNGGYVNLATYGCKNCNKLGHTEGHSWGKDIDGKCSPRPLGSNGLGQNVEWVSEKVEVNRIVR